MFQQDSILLHKARVNLEWLKICVPYSSSTQKLKTDTPYANPVDFLISDILETKVYTA